ncbi:30S ribosomal protein S16 [bacterium (Candidatus Gribaldobacteria) CG08_land_8_20_14_0_20_39_15]|uniref:Small ribosomal subunit protein bS16 n=1 Tax=bacterium (Candidatus Gribaldobacteria) CG08_land_8_20_14_0_20_39_15 TaxID=2014273 RepID=A0A2M6XU21_9BACT|nr:MAG: 30S ribosomal protein S16 [bacterium (Candidatus Gribaldobacteria) CG08_land_8_20_14_0_20_39_15]
MTKIGFSTLSIFIQIKRGWVSINFNMLSIRFFRIGKKNQPLFRVIVTDKKNSSRGGRFLEVIGFYNPLTKEKQIKKERVKHWLSVGAKPSATVYNLLVKEGILTGKKIALHKKSKKEEVKAQSKPKTEEKKAEEKPEVQKESTQEKPQQIKSDSQSPASE